MDGLYLLKISRAFSLSQLSQVLVAGLYRGRVFVEVKEMVQFRCGFTGRGEAVPFSDIFHSVTYCSTLIKHI